MWGFLIGFPLSMAFLLLAMRRHRPGQYVTDPDTLARIRNAPEEQADLDAMFVGAATEPPSKPSPARITAFDREVSR